MIKPESDARHDQRQEQPKIVEAHRLLERLDRVCRDYGDKGTTFISWTGDGPKQISGAQATSSERPLAVAKTSTIGEGVWLLYNCGQQLTHGMHWGEVHRSQHMDGKSQVDKTRFKPRSGQRADVVEIRTDKTSGDPNAKDKSTKSVGLITNGAHLQADFGPTGEARRLQVDNQQGKLEVKFGPTIEVKVNGVPVPEGRKAPFLELAVQSMNQLRRKAGLPEQPVDTIPGGRLIAGDRLNMTASGSMQQSERSTSELFRSFNLPSGTTPVPNAENRISEYVKLKNVPGAEARRLELLANHYLDATSNSQRQQVMNLLMQESMAGNDRAGECIVKLPLMAMADTTERAVSGGPKQMQFIDPVMRRDHVLSQQAKLFSERPNSNLPAVLVEHYMTAKDSQQRREALELLSQEVRLGNQSAVFTLKNLTKLDAALRAGDAISNFSSGVPDGMKQLDSAIQTLARLSQADSQSHHAAPDMLEPTPALGNDQRVRVKDKNDTDSKQSSAHELLKQCINANGGDRNEAIKHLEQLSITFKGKNEGKDYQSALDLATTSRTADDTYYGLGDTDKALQGLINIHKLAASGNPFAQEIITRIGQSSDTANKFIAALGRQNGTEAAVSLTDPELTRVISKEVGRFVNEQHEDISAESVVNALTTAPEFHNLASLYPLHLSEAYQFDAVSRQTCDDAVAAYLQRDSIGKVTRDHLLSALPANGRFQLTDSAMKAELRYAIEEKTLTPRIEHFAGRLVAGDELTQAEVATLRLEMNQTSNERQRTAAGSLESEFDRRVGFFGADMRPSMSALQSLEAARLTHGKVADAIRILSDNGYSNVDCAGALKSSINELRDLQRLAKNDWQNPLALRICDRFPGGTKAFDQLMKDLGRSAERQDFDTAAQLLKTVRKGLPNGEDEANQFRALRIMRDLGPGKSADHFRSAQERLEREIVASRIESHQENKSAIDWSKWARANERVAKISQAAAANKPDDVAAALTQLGQQNKEGNLYARTALAAFLVANSQHSHEFLQTFPNLNGKPIYVPNLDGLDGKHSDQLAKQALNELTAAFGSNLKADLNGGNSHPMNGAETMAIAMMSVKENARGAGDSAEAKKCELLLGQCLGSKPDLTGEVMTGLLAAMALDRTNGKHLADYYVHGLTNPKFADHFDYVKALVTDGNQGAMRVLASVTAGDAGVNIRLRRERIAVDEARLALERTAESSMEMRGQATDALLHVADAKKRDGMPFSPQLIDTLATVASRLDNRTADWAAKGQRAAEHVRVDFEAQMSKMWADKNDQKRTYNNMVLVAKHWSTKESDVFTRDITPLVVTSLQQAAGELKPEVAHSILQTAGGRIQEFLHGTTYSTGQNQEHLLSLIRTCTALSQYSSADQVKQIAALGGTSQWSQDPGDRLLQKRLPAIKDYEIKNIQAEVANSLLSTLSKANDGHARDAAYQAFEAVPWPIKKADGIGFEPSVKSAELRKTLIDYFRGRPYDLDAFKKIAHIVDDAHLPIPAASLLPRTMGGINPADIGTGKTVWEKADRIVNNYTKDGEQGDKVLRRVMANLDTVNHMSGADRAKVMGWDKSFGEKIKSTVDFVGLGLQSLPLDQQKRFSDSKLSEAENKRLQVFGQEKWKSMNDIERDTFLWQRAPRVNVKDVLGAMHEGKLQENELLKALLDKNLVARAEALRDVHHSEQQRQERDAKCFANSRNNEFNQLIDTTQKGASLGGQIIGLFGDGGRDFVLASEQFERLHAMHHYNPLIATASRRAATADMKTTQLDVAIEAGRYRTLVNNGEQIAADKLAMDMLRKHGQALIVVAKDIWQDLNVSPDLTLTGASSLKRLHHRGLTQFDMVPIYDSGLEGFRQALGTESIGSKNATVAAAKDSVLLRAAHDGSKALGTESTSKEAVGVAATKGRGLLQLAKDGSKYLDTDALRAHIFMNIDQDEVMLKFTDASRRISQPVSELEAMASAAKIGTAYEDFIGAAQVRARQVKHELDSIEKEDLVALKTRIVEMKRAVSYMSDEIAQNQLGQKITDYKKLYNLFNESDVIEYPDVAERKEDGSLRNINKAWQKLCKNAETMGADSFGNYLMRNVDVIAATAVATVLTLAAVATFGLTTPAAAAAFALLSYTLTQGGKEVMYQINKDGYTGWGDPESHGADFADWAFRNDHHTLETFWDGVGENALKSIGKDFAGWMLGGYAGKAFFGARPFLTGQPLFAGAPPASAAAARNFLSTFGIQMAKKAPPAAGITLVGQVTAHTTNKAIGNKNVAEMSEAEHFLVDMATTTVMGIFGEHSQRAKLHAAQVLKEGSHHQYELADGATKEAVIEQRRQQGYSVKEVKGNQNLFEVLPADAKPGMEPITVEFVPRGTIPTEVVSEQASSAASKESIATDQSRQLAAKTEQLPPAMALALSQKNVPPGEYQLRIPDQGKTIPLTIGLLPEAATSGGTPKMHDVPIEHVNEVLKAVQSLHISPDRLSIVNLKGSSTEGGVTRSGAFYDVVINTGVGKQPLSMIYHHETGHIFDKAVFERANPEVKVQIFNAYKEGLATNQPAEAAARATGVPCTEAFKADFNRQMVDPKNRDMFIERFGEPMFPEKYHASQGELIAEMFKLYREQISLAAKGEKPLSYDQLVDNFVKPHNEARADMMRGFGKMYEVLSKDVFPQVKPSNPGHADAAPVSSGTQGSIVTQPIAKVLERLNQETSGNGKLTQANAGTKAGRYKNYLEAEIQAGRLSGTQIDALFKLDALDLVSAVEMMRSGSLSAKAMEQIVFWKPSARDAFLSEGLPDAKILSKAIENGIVNETTMESIAEKRGSRDRKIIMDILSQVAADPAFKPENFERLSQFTETQREQIRRAMIEGEVRGLNNRVKLSPEMLDAALSTGLTGTPAMDLISFMHQKGISASSVRKLTECKMFDRFQKLPQEQQIQVANILSNYKTISHTGTEILVKRLMDQPCGKPEVDALITPARAAEILAGNSMQQKGNFALILNCAADYVTGSAKHPIEVLQRLTAVGPGATQSVSNLINNPRMSSGVLQNILGDIAATSDPVLQARQASAHGLLLASNPQFHAQLCALEPALRTALVEPAVHGHLTPEKLSNLLEIRRSSKNAADFMDRVLADSASDINKIELIEATKLNSLSPTELGRLSDALINNAVTLQHVESIVALSPKARTQVVELLASKGGDRTADAMKLLEHLRAGRDPANISDPQKQVQEERDRLNTHLKKLGVAEDTREGLVKYLYDDTGMCSEWEVHSRLRWRREQRSHLLEQLETAPEQAEQLVETFKTNPLRYGAYMKNPELLSKPIDSFVVVARGETKNSGNYEDWTNQFNTAAGYHADKARNNRHLHLVVIRKDSVSPALWAWAYEKAKPMDLGKKEKHWVDQRAHSAPSGELEKTCESPQLQIELKNKADHYSIDLD